MKLQPSVVFCWQLAIAALAVAQVPSGPADWPQWRGPNRDGIAHDKGLLKEWPEAGPKVVWQVDSVGVGYSSLAVKDGRIFTQGDLNGVEHTIALDVKDGRVLWAVQPEPVAKDLAERVAKEFVRLDKNADGQVDEAEALAGLGWRFNDADKAAGSPDPNVVAVRVERLLGQIDADKDGKLSFSEAGNLFREYFTRIDATDKAADPAVLAKSRAEQFVAQLDKDENKQVSRQEARGSLLDQSFGQIDQKDPQTMKGDEQLTVAEIEPYLLKNQPGKDGVITKSELLDFYGKSLSGDGLLSKAELRSMLGGLRDGQGDGPRGTPTVDGDRVFVEGGMGDVACFEAATGKTIWHVNLSKDLAGGRPGWGYSESPLVEGNLLIITPGGKGGTLAALDKYTGQVVWRSMGSTQGAHYSSPVAADIAGVRQIVQFASQSLFGVAANSGALLWQYSAANNGTANCCTPVVHKNFVLASSSYGQGGGLAEISTDGDKQAAKEVYFDKKLANHHGGIVLVGDHIYSLGSGTLICMEYLTGKIAWQHRSIGKGSLLVADNMLYLFSEGHQVALAEVTPEGYREKGKFKIASHGRPSWAHPVVAGGRLYLRDQQSLTSYDVRAN